MSKIITTDIVIPSKVNNLSPLVCNDGEPVTTSAGQFSNAIGDSAESSGKFSTALGNYAKAAGESSVAVGSSPKAPGEKSIAIGLSAEATGVRNIAIGNLTKATGEKQSIAIGNVAKSRQNFSLAIGTGCSNYNTYSTSMGYCTNAGQSGVAIGCQANAMPERSTAIGTYARVDSSDTFNPDSLTGDLSSINNSVALGYGSYVAPSDTNVVSVGSSGRPTTDTWYSANNNTEAPFWTTQDYSTGIIGNFTRRIINVSDQVNNQDAATKAYVDNKMTGSGGFNFIPFYLTLPASETENPENKDTTGVLGEWVTLGKWQIATCYSSSWQVSGMYNDDFIFIGNGYGKASEYFNTRSIVIQRTDGIDPDGVSALFGTFGAMDIWDYASNLNWTPTQTSDGGTNLVNLNGISNVTVWSGKINGVDHISLGTGCDVFMGKDSDNNKKLVSPSELSGLQPKINGITYNVWLARGDLFRKS